MFNVVCNWLLMVTVITPLIATPALAQLPSASLDTLMQTFARQRRPRGEGIRRGAICAITPATDRLQQSSVIWSDRPLFLWQANPNVVQVNFIQIYNPETDEIVWEKSLVASDQSAIYDGTALQPGHIYAWELKFTRQNPQTQTWEPETLSSTFQVMASTQRNSITTQLQQFASSREATPDAIAIQQADYLMQQGLLSDALQVIYEVSPSSTQLTQALQTMVNNVCSNSNSL